MWRRENYLIKIKFSRKTTTIIIVALCFALLLIGAKLHSLEAITSVYNEMRTKGDADNEYIITADFDSVEKRITVTQTVYYTHHSDIPANALYFHLYPNAFKTKKHVPFDKDEMNFAYPNGFEQGYIQINEIMCNEPLNYVIMGLGDSILKVHLNNTLNFEDQIEIKMEYEVQLPPAHSRFGYGDNTINIANWYPILSVFDHQGWNLEPYHSIGDPFYSEVADYRVIISMPGEYVMASTGDVIKKENIEGKVRWTIEAENVRSFAMILSDKFKILSGEVDGIEINSYYIEDIYGDIALQAAKDSIKIFNELFGKYPYKQFSVAAADFFTGGMEYPNLVFINNNLYSEQNKEILEYVVVHETAHQWWYGLVGNDEVDESWLDEALAVYSSLLYYEKKYGKEVKEERYNNMIVKPYEDYIQRENDSDKTIYRSIKNFKNSKEYQIMVYYKGAMFLQELRNVLGDEQFFKILKIYFDKYKYKNATTQDFLDVCEAISNKDLEGLFEEWLRYEKE